MFQLVLDSADDSGDEIIYDDKVLSEADIEPFIELLLIATSNCVAGDDEPILAVLRRNAQSLTPKRVGDFGSAKVETLATAAFFEILSPVKFAMCSVNEGLCTLMSSDVWLFHEFFEEPKGKAMKPVISCMLVISKEHLDKTVASPGVGAYVKGDDTLPQWVKESTRHQEAEPRSAMK